ncbi:Mechanosensitive ion channel-domain-containing protein [Mucor mucedo]|uniref:Mechanosensitive ion channel-domain-containing protein n=1 Tax=Mucor mucedo TaxID=29922 RepID=UPI002220E0FA|nr:Mechanosensitive ion channel-domain-containing protein [Mucor mucedo]KAI7888946.1 Mechanosensitive ion channel-domain-containing protein [Mucor mucedo]
MTMKSKSVRIQSEDEVHLIPENPDPLVNPLLPPGASHSRKTSKNDEQPFYSIQMQQEDNFFYDPSNGNPYSTTTKTQLDTSNPFKDPEYGRKTIVSEPTTYVDDATRITQELEDVEEKQFEQEERDLSGTANTTNSSTPVASVRGDDHDSDREFNWDDDPDQVKPKRRKTARERFTAVMKTPCCWHYLSPLLKRVIIAILGSCMFIIIAIVIYLTLPEPTESQKLDPNFKNIRSNVQCWMYWAAFMWHIYWGTTFILDIVPSTVSLFSKLFHGRRSEKVKSYMEYYMSLKGYLCLILLASWNLGSWEFLINYPFNSIKLHSYSAVISKVFGCLLAASGLFFVQKAIIQRIAVKFHRTAYADRLKENKQSLSFLDTLSKSEKKSRPGSSTPGISNRNLRKRRSLNKNGPPESKHNSSSSHDEKANGGSRKPRPMTLNDDATEQASTFNMFKKSIANIVLADKPTATTGRVDKNKMDINSDDYAKKVARKLFYSLAYPEGYHGHEEEDRKYLDIFSFVPYFSEHDQATEAFKVFDKDGNGNVSRREFRDTVIQIYRERKSLAQSIRDTSQALGKVDTILLVISSLITVVICLSIFRVDFWAALIPFGTLLAALTFVFDTSARSLFAGILFQFVTHPYDSGDLVMIDGNFMWVENIGILGTVFVGGDGTQQYVPTTVLLTKIICNVRRSGNMGESLVFNIDFRTENDLILVLRERLLEWVQSQSRDFGPGFDLRVKDIIDMNQVILNAWLPHKGNWVELDKRFQRKTRFLLALKSILTELDIKYELPAQRITSNTDNNPFQNTQPRAQIFNEQTRGT